MAKDNVVFDDSEFIKRLDELVIKVEAQMTLALQAMADEALRLSQKEVPLDTGELMRSGHTEPEGKDILIGYNKTYAAYLHENPQFNFQNNRKGKYLEDPIKMNLKIFNVFFKDTMGKVFNG